MKGFFCRNHRYELKVLDVSSGRGTQNILYAQEFNVSVTGLDISEEMILVARQNVEKSGVSNKITFVKGDSQGLAGTIPRGSLWTSIVMTV